MSTLLRRGWVSVALLSCVCALACTARVRRGADRDDPKGGAPEGGGGVATDGGGGSGVAGGVTNGGAPVGGNGGFGPGGFGPGGFGGSGLGGEGAGSLGGSGPVECSMLPSYPVAYEALQGFTPAEDFAFDSLGNHVSVDANGNLVRTKKTGEVSLWIPSFANNSAGMVALPDDSVVVCDVENSSLKRAFPNGASSVLLGGLDYPNGIDVGPDGFIYVAEDNGGRVLRVNPTSGAFTVVVEVSHPNGVAFTDDPTLFYVGSYNEGLIYKVVQPTPGQPGTASVFAPPQAFEGGGIDGLGVDKCANVYAAEFVSGNVYRITSEGVVSKIVDLPSTWIPNIKWGRGIGGFARHVMYVADREQGRLFGIAVEAEGVTEFFDL